MADKSISLEQIQEQQRQLSDAVTTLTTQRNQLEEQLATVRNQLATNIGALQYANALLTSLTGEEGLEDPVDVTSEDASDTETLEIEETGEEVTL